MVEVLNAIYEQDFLGFSYGFRPGRGQHDALDAPAVSITQRHVNWILDTDLAAYFDTVSHDWMLRFLEHRIGDRRLLRLISNWLKAGVMEEGVVTARQIGTPRALIGPAGICAGGAPQCASLPRSSGPRTARSAGARPR